MTDKIGQNVAEFLAAEIASGRVPKCFLPIQSGVGDIANAVLGALGKHPDIPAFEMLDAVTVGESGIWHGGRKWHLAVYWQGKRVFNPGRAHSHHRCRKCRHSIRRLQINVMFTKLLQPHIHLSWQIG